MLALRCARTHASAPAPVHPRQCTRASAPAPVPGVRGLHLTGRQACMHYCLQVLYGRVPRRYGEPPAALHAPAVQAVQAPAAQLPVHPLAGPGWGSQGVSTPLGEAAPEEPQQLGKAARDPANWFSCMAPAPLLDKLYRLKR